MDQYLLALGFAALPALGNFGGGLLAEAIRISPQMLSYALHAAAGVVLGVVGVELMPQALDADPAWIPVLAFVLGGGFFLAADSAINLVSARFGEAGEDAGPWVIYFGVAMDLFSDGIMIGTGSLVSSSLGLLLALGQVPADIPEGFAVVANFKKKRVPRRQRLLITAAFAIPIFLGTTLGYWAVKGQSELVKFSLLAFTAGVLTTVVVEEIVPEAHAEGGARFAAMAMVGGFALFALLSAYVG